jgi:aspartate/methionine/tyrosine aminotransferase
MRLADRMSKLGTETAFAVSSEAAAFAAQGNRVYPFHLGDMNLQTPRNIIEATERAIADGKTGYCPPPGIPQLRELLAEDINRTHDTQYGMENVAIQPGGKPVIGKLFMAMMNPGDEVLYPNPGYPIYESQIEFHGGTPVPYSYLPGGNTFAIDVARIEELVTDRTRILVLNDLQNPMGAEAGDGEFRRLAEIVEKHNLFVLCDEAYFDLRYSGQSRSFASLPGMAERCLLLYTFSKKFAMTGWRLGAAIGPTELVDAMAKLNVNAESCSNHFIQYGAMEALTGDPSGYQEILRILQQRRDRTVELLNAIDGVTCFRPEATFYLFPDVTDVMKRTGLTDYEQFRSTCLAETGVSFCTRRHFGRPLDGETRSYIRFAYSGIDMADIEKGLGRLKTFLESPQTEGRIDDGKVLLRS